MSGFRVCEYAARFKIAFNAPEAPALRRAQTTAQTLKVNQACLSFNPFTTTKVRSSRTERMSIVIVYNDHLIGEFLQFVTEYDIIALVEP